MITSHADYLENIFSSPKRFESSLNRAAKTILLCERLSGIRSDALACSGASGIAFASALANRPNRRLIVVRKKGENSHSSYSVEGQVLGPYRYTVIDDLISSGKTVCRIIRSLEVGRGSFNACFLYLESEYGDSFRYKTRAGYCDLKAVKRMLNSDCIVKLNRIIP